MAMKFVGSICLSDIPKDQIKVIECKDGVKRAYLNISVHESSKPQVDDKTGRVISDHFISCSPKQEERVEGVNYIVGNLRTWETKPQGVSTADIAAAPPATNEELENVNLPF